jgi:predicted DNA-binding transcriptional regulator AlpA
VDERRIAISVREAAHRASLSRSGLYALWTQGKGPPRIKVGKRTLILIEALDRWLQQLEEQNDV